MKIIGLLLFTAIAVPCACDLSDIVMPDSCNAVSCPNGTCVNNRCVPGPSQAVGYDDKYCNKKNPCLVGICIANECIAVRNWGEDATTRSDTSSGVTARPTTEPPSKLSNVDGMKCRSNTDCQSKECIRGECFVERIWD